MWRFESKTLPWSAAYYCGQSNVFFLVSSCFCAIRVRFHVATLRLAVKRGSNMDEGSRQIGSVSNPYSRIEFYQPYVVMASIKA